MATKTNVQRIVATLNYLQNTNVASLAARTPAHLLAQTFVNTRWPMGAASPGYDAFSQELSLGWHLFDDPNERRHMTRALFLLWKAIHWRHGGFAFPKANISQVSQATADRQLANYIRKARCVQDETAGGNAGTTQALADFTANPLAFMRDNKVYVQGSTAMDPVNPTNVQPCNFYYQADRDRYVFAVRGGAIMPASPVAIQVDSVKAFHWTDARYVGAPGIGGHNIATANFGALTGIPLSGANIMVTTQFTGCSFCMAAHGGAVYCAHVSPFVNGMAPNTDGQTLARRILHNGAMQNAGGNVPVVYGRNAGTAPHAAGYNIGGGGGNATYMTIVGFPGGVNGYEIFAQTTENDRIQGVPVQIF